MPSDFHEVLFPTDIARGARGGPTRLTEIVTLASGREHRNARWADSRRRYDAGLGIRTLDALHAVLTFFEERRGRLIGFRFRDRTDDRSCEGFRMATLTRGFGDLLRVGVRKPPGEEAAVAPRRYGDFALVPIIGRAFALPPAPIATL